MNAATLKLLGLADNATPEEIHERIADNAARAHDADSLDGKLSAATEAKTAAEAAVKKIADERKAENTTRLAADRAKLDQDARARGLWEPGSDTQKLYDRLADQSLELAKDFISTLSPSNPVGQPRQATPGSNPPPSSGSIEAGLRGNYRLDDLEVEIARSQFRQLGITDDMFKQSAPHVVDAAEREPGYDWLAVQEGN